MVSQDLPFARHRRVTFSTTSVVKDWSVRVQARIVKIFELAFLLDVTPLLLPTLRLVFRPTITPYSVSIWMAKAEGSGDGLETTPGVYHGDSRSSTAVAQRVPGDGESYPASPDHGPCAVDGWRTQDTGHHWPEAGQAGPQGRGQDRQARHDPWLAASACGPEV